MTRVAIITEILTYEIPVENSECIPDEKLKDTNFSPEAQRMYAYFDDLAPEYKSDYMVTAQTNLHFQEIEDPPFPSL